tara:strand:- start:719 stop:1372 length:654 start_codon:yes stop_codon:yes gene_type:complete
MPLVEDVNPWTGKPEQVWEPDGDWYRMKAKPKRVLIACERSGKVREAFNRLGHDATSCDLEPTDIPGKHHQGDVLPLLSDDWDLVLAFPPCTHLASSGARWFKEKREDGRQEAAINFFMAFTKLDHIPQVAIENPIGIMSSQFRKPDQIVQPWEFGHGETKATCLWLKGLPLLRSTKVVDGREERIHRMAPSPDRSKKRSETYSGIAMAMAQQWGKA